jgi:hypothetical protein
MQCVIRIRRFYWILPLQINPRNTVTLSSHRGRFQMEVVKVLVAVVLMLVSSQALAENSEGTETSMEQIFEEGFGSDEKNLDFDKEVAGQELNWEFKKGGLKTAAVNNGPDADGLDVALVPKN